RVRVGVISDCISGCNFPLPLIPSRKGRGKLTFDEVIILECPYLFHRVALDDGLPRCQVFGLVPEGPGILHQHISQSRIAAPFRLVADGIHFAEVFSFNDDVIHKCVRGKE
ncbi:MAG: hypothetical protein KKH02_13000, partial [Proteobacteria bacterium]|nr:hypothetical protein [Pseudomonadota bacterium]